MMHWQPATSSTLRLSMSPGHIAPFENGSSYCTVSPSSAACEDLGFPDVVLQVFITFSPRLLFCLQASRRLHAYSAHANAFPALSLRFFSAFSNTPSGVVLSPS